MDIKTEALMRELADKLGTTVEHLWGVMVRQGPIQGVVELLLLAGMVGIIVALWRAVRAKISGDDPEWDCDEMVSAICCSLALISLIAAAITFAVLPMAITGILNPEYWALKQLLP